MRSSVMSYVSRYQTTPSPPYASTNGRASAVPYLTNQSTTSMHPPISLPENLTSPEGESHTVSASSLNGSRPVTLSAKPSAWRGKDLCETLVPSRNSRPCSTLGCHGSIPKSP